MRYFYPMSERQWLIQGVQNEQGGFRCSAKLEKNSCKEKGGIMVI
tara:strand:+ start:257 stop:391 length:135 start_codon:yes stop_codon:yes gene_type:complete